MNRKILFLALLWSCQNPKAVQTPFYFPEKAPVEDWCKIESPEAVPLFPDPADGAARYFVMQPGVYRLLNRLGNATSATMLKIDEQGRVGVYTADLLPTCLSRREGYSIDDHGNLQYNNNRYVTYALRRGDTEYGPALFIKPKGELLMGINVYRCDNCR